MNYTYFNAFPRSRELSEMQQPAKLIVLGDKLRNGIEYIKIPSDSLDSPDFRHGGAPNGLCTFLYADGHVQSLRQEQIDVENWTGE